MAWSMERFAREMHNFDSQLRIRLSWRRDRYLIERKVARDSSVMLDGSKSYRDYDMFICARDRHIPVMEVPRAMLDKRVFLELRAHDMWEYGGAGPFADHLEAMEAQNEAKHDKEQSSHLQDVSSEAYDKMRVLARGKFAGSDIDLSEQVFNNWGGEKHEPKADASPGTG